MRRLIVAALSALILLCVFISTLQGRGLRSIRWIPLMINLLRGGSPDVKSSVTGATPMPAPGGECDAAPNPQESVSLEPGKPVERGLFDGMLNTGLGKEIKDLWLIGVTRGFMYAGAPCVVASEWKVDDRATSELMKRFYQ